MRCSKVVICNRSRNSGSEFNGCDGGDGARESCPEWILIVTLKNLLKTRNEDFKQLDDINERLTEIEDKVL